MKVFAKKTDLTGLMTIASDLLSGTKRKKLYVLSDGMNCTEELNLEKAPQRATGFMKKLLKIDEFPRGLRGADVFWLGAGGPGITSSHFKSLKLFWKGYVERSGGYLRCFSSLREVK